MRGGVNGYRWVILGVGSQAALSAAQQGLPVIGPALRDQFALSLSQVGLLLTTVIWGITITLRDHRGLTAGAAALGLAAIRVGGGLVRIVAGRRSDRDGRRIPLMRREALAMASALAATALLVDAPAVVLLPVLVVAGVLMMSWNGLAFTAAAEMSGRRRAGTALGLQGTILRVPQAFVGVAFGALVASVSWAAGFAVLGLLPLAGWWVLRPLEAEEGARVHARERRLAAAAPRPAARHEPATLS